MLLLGGDPGIGSRRCSSSDSHARARGAAPSISQAEAVAQVRLRAGDSARRRRSTRVDSVEDILATLSERSVRLVIIDSFRRCGRRGRLYTGTVAQVRASAQALIRFAKRSGAAIILVSHVWDGQIASPRVVDMVDAVLSFEGEGSHHFRILRAVKNRFGPTDEIGMFEMTGEGLCEVANPSRCFSPSAISVRPAPRSCRHRGTRPLLVRSGAGGAHVARHATARRGRVGSSRLSMVLAVLEAGGVRLSATSISMWLAVFASMSRRPIWLRCRLILARPCAAAGRRGLFRRDFALGRGAAGGAGRGPAQGSQKARLWPRRYPGSGAFRGRQRPHA